MNQSVTSPSPLIEIDTWQFQVQINMIYATADNLAGKVIYPTTR
ncbi:MAG: D-alanyl-D-alanine dipeptidase, partial [Pseudomonas helleri]